MGTNLRDAITMRDDEVTVFLAEERTAVMCTMHPRGSIHAVAMWYGFIGSELAMETKVTSQKARNLARDCRMTVLIEAGETYEQLRGVELVGSAEITEDQDQLWQLGVSMYERYFGPYTEQERPAVKAMLHNRVAIKLKTERIASWDHRKLPA